MGGERYSLLSLPLSILGSQFLTVFLRLIYVLLTDARVYSRQENSLGETAMYSDHDQTVWLVHKEDTTYGTTQTF